MSTGSKYLKRLDNDFKRITPSDKMKLFWAYETKATPTVAVGQPEKDLRHGTDTNSAGPMDLSEGADHT